ncbi:Dg [Bugula neritina]|uniref:Dg n=1 Tax=Bugula neritina TaxID=10212 RepID=A0A7J7JXF7_BUGNE|nr:Dg [Bugula neritina]
MVPKPPLLNPNYSTPLRLKMSSGQLFTYQMPNDLFSDPNNEILKFSVRDFSTDRDVDDGRGSWLSYDKINNELLALPLDVNVGTSKYLLVAMNSHGLMTTVHLTLAVRPRSTTKVTQNTMKLFNSLNCLTTSLIEYRNYTPWPWPPPFSGSARQMLDLVYTLSSLLVDSEDRQIMVDGVEYSDKTTVKFSVSPPAGHSASLCPTDINRKDLKTLRQLKDLQLLIYKTISKLDILYVRSFPKSPCENSSPIKTTDISVLEPFMSQLVAVEGELFKVKVPVNLFEDQEDINLQFMKLELLTDGVELNSANWIYLHKQTGTIMGLPWGHHQS